MTKLNAYLDQQKDSEQRVGLMHCFCLDKFIKDPVSFLDIRFRSIDPADNTEYCNDWLINYGLQNAMIIGTSLVVVLINVIICVIFEQISKLERHHTQNAETLGQFQKITIMQFVNIAVVVLMVNFNLRALEGKMLFGFIPILNGEHMDFTVSWYYNVGATLCTTLLFNIFSPHASKLLQPVLVCCKRCCDRRCSCQLKANRIDSNCNKVNTKKELQSDLQALYTGPQIMSHYVYAQLFTNLWSCLMYSSGLPVLYPLSMVFYIILYFVYKLLLFKFYQRTSKFNEQLALYSIGFIKYGLLFHMIVGGFMYSNSRILAASTEEALQELTGYISILHNNFISSRFKSTHSQLYLAVFVLLVLIYLFQTIILSFVKQIFVKFLFCGICRKKQATAVIDEVTSEDIFRELSIASLTDLFKRVTSEYDEFKDMVRTSNYDKSKMADEVQQKFDGQ